jgi:hypothetical protein
MSNVSFVPPFVVAAHVILDGANDLIGTSRSTRRERDHAADCERRACRLAA